MSASAVMAQQQAEVVAKMQAAAKEQGQGGQAGQTGGAVHRDRAVYRIAPYAIPLRPQYVSLI